MRRVALLLAFFACSLDAQTVTNINAEPTMQDIIALQSSVLQSEDRTLDAAGNDTWTYPKAFVSPPRVMYFPQNTDTSGKPIVCNWQTRTATSLTYHCDKGTGPIANLLQNAFSAVGMTGTVVSVSARGTIATP